jgi:NADH-quinone oxidoreductase subunit J
MVTAAQVILSYLLVLGLLLGVGSLICASLVRFMHRRRLLALLASVGFSCFLYGTLALTPPGFRLFTFYFWLFGATILGGAIGTVTMRNVFHSALMLILCLFGVAGFFILVNAEFLAAVQVIIYIGGIMVLFLFGIMVSQNIIGTEIRQNTPQAPWAALAATVLFLFMLVTGLFMNFPPQEMAGKYVLANNTQSIGWSLMATFTLPFEVASLLLLIAMMGAIILVRKD